MRILCVAIVAVALLARGAAGEPWPVCGATGMFTANSRYLANINLIGTYLPKNASASPDLFATAEDVGAIPAQVSALALCRGDTNATSCASCLGQAFPNLINSCAYTKDAAIYYDACKLYYSDIHFLTAVDTGMISLKLEVSTGSGTVTSELDRYNSLVAELVNATADYAAYNTTRRYAAGEADFNREFPKIYSMAQCTPDLTPARCRSCLAQTVAYGNGLVLGNGLIGGRIDTVRCSFRFETSTFFTGPVMVRLAGTPARAPAPAPAPVVPTVTLAAAAGEGTKYRVRAIVVAILLPIVAVINLVACFFFWRRRRSVTKEKQKHVDYTTGAEDMESVDSMMIDISTLRSATGDFAESNKLGEGGFGAVYKGTLPDGTEIAVKRLSKSSTQGVEELKNELALVAKLKHRNLVSLVGVCLEQQERLLVYEFVPNRSLDQILFDSEKREQLDWEKRYKIINGIARGLQYLHEDSQLKVVHRDLKASNILLDMNMNPKISDFGLARLFGRDQTQAVTSRIIGTHGYMAPEYVMRGNYSVKSDAYSFGVMVLEIVTGRKNNDGYNSQKSEDLLSMVWEHWTAGRVSEMVDASLNGRFMEGDVRRCIHIGLMCVQGNPVDRPVMSSVVMMLGSDTVSLMAPSKPAFFGRNDGGDRSDVSTATM